MSPIYSFQCPDDVAKVVNAGIKKGKWISRSDALRELVREGVKPFLYLLEN